MRGSPLPALRILRQGVSLANTPGQVRLKVIRNTDWPEGFH